MNILHSKVELRVPLSKLYYDAKSFRFNWDEVILTIPYGQQALTVKDGQLLEGFKKNLNSEITIRFRWHRIHNRVDEMKVSADESASEEIKDVLSRANNLISELKALIVSGALNINEARGAMKRSKLKYDDETIYQLLTDIVHRMREKRIEVTLQVPLSELEYDSFGFRYKWNGVWLSVPYEQESLNIKEGRLLEVFKNTLKSDITLCTSWNRVFQGLDNIGAIITPNASKELDDLSSRITKCISEVKSLTIARGLSFEKAQAVFTENSLKCSDKKMHQILSEIIDSIKPHGDPVNVDVPLSDIEYSSYDITFHWLSTTFKVGKDALPFEPSPNLEKIKNRLKGHITFHVVRDSIVKWDSRTDSLLVGDVRTGIEQVEVTPGALVGLKDLRASIICDAVNILDRKTISIEQVQSILEEWGLDVKNQEIGLKIAESIPKWNIEVLLKIPANDVEYSSYGIKVPSKYGQEFYIPSKELPFGTSDVLEGIKGILEGNINIVKHYSERFVWDEAEKQIKIEKSSESYEVTVTDDFLDSLKFEDVEFISPSDTGSLVGPTNRTSWGNPRSTGYYDLKCIRFLKDIVKRAKGNTYITSVDLWFKIDGMLIWERPVFGAATYVFRWPDKPINKFIHETWGTTLEYTRRHPEESSYLNRVIHDYDALYSWRSNLKSNIRKYAGILV